MNFVTALFAPFALLLPAMDLAGAGQEPAIQVPMAAEEGIQLETADSQSLHMFPDSPGFLGGNPVPDWAPRVAAESFQPEEANQVRIEQHMTIRIAPHPSPVRPDVFMDPPDSDIAPRYMERKIGKCVPISGISSVQTGDDNRLILFMRDRRVVSAELERACRARDFYSGFYIARNQDGQLCVDRDMLLSRSGANCKLSRIRQLIDIDP